MQSLGFLALNAAEASLFKSGRIPCSPFSDGFLRSDSSFQFEFSAISLHWLRSLSLFVVVKELKKVNNELGFVFFLLFLALGLFGILFLGIGERLSGVVVKIFRSRPLEKCYVHSLRSNPDNFNIYNVQICVLKRNINKPSS